MSQIFARLFIAMLASTLSSLIFAADVDYRLPKSYAVSEQSIALTLDPAKDGFTGTTGLKLVVHEPVDRIGLHWVGLAVTPPQLTDAKGSVRTLTFEQGDYEMWWLSDGKTIAPGEYSLDIAFSGDYSRDALGLYKTTFAGRDYLFTQYEQTLARRATPMIDEPDSKIPWQLTITAPEGLKVASNTPVESQSESGDLVTRVFKQTPPMPSYLLALIVGDFDVTPIDGLSVPGVIYSPKGTGGDTGFAAKVTPPILSALEDYFGSGLPYEKLDFVAVPDFSFGAMENVGLVTYRTELLLRGDSASGSAAANSVNTIAHELAHMWYGNLVTMEWWDDLWLNEAFATWMADKIVDELYPQYETNLQLPQALAFGADSVAQSRPIRKEVKTDEDVLDGFGLNYSKGHSILNMLEQSMGEDAFQRAIQTYMGKHRWSNTRASDLWAALATETSVAVDVIADSYLELAGFPLITFGKDGVVSQTRFHSPGAKLPEQQWQIPVVTRHRDRDTGKLTESVFALSSQSVVLPQYSKAEWILPGAGGNGYYVWHTGDQRYQALLENLDELSAREKAAVLANSNQLLQGDIIGIDQHLQLLGGLLADDSMTLALSAVNGLRGIAGMYFHSELQPELKAFITRALTPWYEQLGTQTRDDDSDSARDLRPRVLRTLAEFGDKPELVAEMTKLADQYLTQPESVDPRLGHEALRVAALFNGDEAMAKRYIAAYRETNNSNLRSNLAYSMYFRDSAAAQAVFQSLEKDDIQSGDTSLVITGLFYAQPNQRGLYQTFEGYFDMLSAKIPEFYRPTMPAFTTANCNSENLALRETFYASRDSSMLTQLRKSQESTKNCIDTAERGYAAMAAFLGGS
ncbi:M1 family metallopeptidase [Congregibacter variabilis]|uniref:Aminopeptidase n=1 Tax=Congregibacter variabilis TaxID=3081200 RepID=A0ABZ0I6L5_9GAMM|nr:M1 family metallopeptidase [Congregibacter sp. IMCC43200]